MLESMEITKVIKSKTEEQKMSFILIVHNYYYSIINKLSL